MSPLTVNPPLPTFGKSCTLAVVMTSAPGCVAAYAAPAFVATLAPETMSASYPPYT